MDQTRAKAAGVVTPSPSLRKGMLWGLGWILSRAGIPRDQAHRVVWWVLRPPRFEEVGWAGQRSTQATFRFLGLLEGVCFL